MTRLLAVLVLALGAGCAVIVAAGDAHGVPLTLTILTPIGLVALLIAHGADRGILPLPTLRHRFQLGVGLAIAQLLAALVIGAILMFVSDRDAWATIAILAFAAVIAVYAARVLLRPVVRDVTAIGEALQAVEKGDRDVRLRAGSSRELATLARTGNRMIVALAAEERARDEADAARRQVIAAVSHDLRTPLTSLRLLVEALNDNLVDERTAREYLVKMEHNVRSLGTLVDDLFELSRLNAGDFAWRTEAVPLADLVTELVAAMRVQADERGVQVTSEIADDLAPARANPERLARVLANLLQNAIHHTPQDGSVCVRAQRCGENAEIEVADTGAGIAEQDRARVFEPFYRGGPDAARTTGGSGLGLAIARAIVEAHGGRIWLADAGEGTRVRFTLPLAS